MKQTHKQFQQAVIETARHAGFEFVYHTFDSRHSPAGFPDLVMLKEKVMIVAELKIPPDQLKPEQYFWLLAFSMITEHVYLWNPCDEDWQEIQEVLFRDR